MAAPSTPVLINHKDEQILMQKMYDELASWWPLLSPPEDYADEAEFFWQVLSESGLPDSPSLLELGSGGGCNALYLKKHFATVTLSDLSPGMIAESRTLNPGCEHIEGDMRDLRLERVFDAVFIHDAIDHMTSIDDLRHAMVTAFIHTKSGGIALFVPDQVTETFKPSTEQGGKDGEDRALRYLEWSHDADETDTTHVTDYVYLLRESNLPLRVEHEQHTYGLFPREQWLELLREVGFEPHIIKDHYERELFSARKP